MLLLSSKYYTFFTIEQSLLTALALSPYDQLLLHSSIAPSPAESQQSY